MSGARVSVQVSDSSAKLPWAWEEEVLASLLWILLVCSGSPNPLQGPYQSGLGCQQVLKQDMVQMQLLRA